MEVNLEKDLDKQLILNHVDHTLLAVDATENQIKGLCHQAEKWHTASVCVSPCNIITAKKFLQHIPLCTVIGFPSGQHTSSVKVYEAENAVSLGADEIDMVINIGWVKSKRFSDVFNEIKQIRNACPNQILKVIIETCLLTDSEKIELCHIVSDSGADFIKTSTGFSTGGATAQDIKLISTHISPHLKIKASGGIRSFADASVLMNCGAERLGTSRLVALAEKNIWD